jgi:hypothetical protein
MIVVETVLPADGASVVVVRFSIVVVEVWAKAGALNTRRAPAATSRPLISYLHISHPLRRGRTHRCEQDEGSDHSAVRGRVKV